MTGLSVSDVVNVQVVMSPLAAQERNFGSLLVLGDSSVIDVVERLRPYTSIEGIASDFGTASPEYQAALLYFSQSPQPQLCYMGRWARSATRGQLRGGALSVAQQAIANFTGVANGGMNITIDGVVQSLGALDFSAQTNLNGVASVVQTALGVAGTVTWDANNGRFIVRSATTGPASGVSVATPPSSGTDVSVLLGLRSSSGAYSAAGINAESLKAAVQTLLERSNDWYGLQVASSVAPTTADHLEVAALIEAAGISRIMGVTTQDPGTLDAVETTDLASQLKALGYKRTFVQYSSSSAYATASIFGRAFTVNFGGVNTTITLKFKQLPGVAPETLTAAQARALDAKNCNAFVRYNNDTAILQEGKMANGFFFDEVHGIDWLQNALQTDQYNLLYTSDTKIPQTDQGGTRMIARASGICAQAASNGLLAPGVWNGPRIGALNTGDTLSTGYYIYMPPFATQSQANREKRKPPLMQIAAKLAGATHFGDILVNVNR